MFAKKSLNFPRGDKIRAVSILYSYYNLYKMYTYNDMRDRDRDN